MSAGHVKSVSTSRGVLSIIASRRRLKMSAAWSDPKMLYLTDTLLQVAKMVNEQMILIELLAKNLAETTQRVSKIEEKIWTKRDICTN